MKILQTVVVKQVLTETSKKQLFDKYRQKKIQLQKECDQLKFELKKLERSKKYQPDDLKRHFEREANIRKEKIKLLNFQTEQLHILPLGSELIEKEVQAIIEVNRGDSWDDLLGGKTIIVKDGIVEEIREG